MLCESKERGNSNYPSRHYLAALSHIYTLLLSTAHNPKAFHFPSNGLPSFPRITVGTIAVLHWVTFCLAFLVTKPEQKTKPTFAQKRTFAQNATLTGLFPIFFCLEFCLEMLRNGNDSSGKERGILRYTGKEMPGSVDVTGHWRYSQ